MFIKQAKREDINKISEIYLLCWQTTYANLVPDSYLESLSLVNIINKWEDFFNNEDNSFIYVAFNEKNEYLGFVAGMIKDDCKQGEILALYLLDKYQGLGLGKKLFMKAIEYFINHDTNTMIVWVMKNNKKGINFYEKRQGKIFKQRQSNLDGYIVDDVAYYWFDLKSVFK